MIYQLSLLAKTKDLGETKQRYNELKEQHQEKSRQHQKLQVQLFDGHAQKEIREIRDMLRQ